MVDQKLARSFEGIGEDYERFRPGFPVDAAEAIVPERVDVVVDLGAGTGKFTRLLEGRASHVIGVEPSLAMLDVLRARLPWVDAREGGAELMPVADALADAVVVAQAFHWFDRDLACAEIARVLVPDGVLGLVWNRSVAECAWDRACQQVMHPAVVFSDDLTTASAAEELPGFVFEVHEEFRWSEQITRSDYIERWRTVSDYLVADDETRAAKIARVEAVLDGAEATAGRESFELPHVTDVFVYRVSGPRGTTGR